MPDLDHIEVRGARENNLREVSVDIPKRAITVFTGVSGSGKSSLVFGTIAAESQRLINETYTAFIQSFMPNVGRPDVDTLRNLSAAILVDQERMGANSRSTVGTATDEVDRASEVLVLDEPTTGLHMDDVDHLVDLLNDLVDRGRTPIVIEHDLDVVAGADWVIDIGPGAGHDGGTIVFEGPPHELVKAEGSLTGRHLRERLRTD